MEPELPAEFDVVVVGTGLTESIFAGACARAGKSVLHLDHNPHYGARQATYTLNDFVLWLRGELLDSANEQRPERVDPAAVPADAAGGRALVSHVADVPHGVTFISAPTPADEAAGWSPASAGAEPPEELRARSSRFCVDVTPQLIRCGGPMVDALRSSGVASYLEFKPINLHAYHEGGDADVSAPLRRVPCTKGDIFKSSAISLVEKRQLMKFLQSCAAMQATLEPHIPLPPQAAAAPDAPPAPPPAIGATFAEFCKASRLSPPLRDMATYALLHHPGPRNPEPSDGTDGTLPTPAAAAAAAAAAASLPSAREGIVDVCRHLRSLGKFGPTAYLAPYYGTSELPQAFCRLCAVWGGTYMLARRAYALQLSRGEVTAVADAAGRWIQCKWVLLNADNELARVAAGDAAAGAEALFDAQQVQSVCVCSVWVPCVAVPSGGRSSTRSSPQCGSPVGGGPLLCRVLFPVASVSRLASRSCSRSRCQSTSLFASRSTKNKQQPTN